MKFLKIIEEKLNNLEINNKAVESDRLHIKRTKGNQIKQYLNLNSYSLTKITHQTINKIRMTIT